MTYSELCDRIYMLYLAQYLANQQNLINDSIDDPETADWEEVVDELSPDD